MARGSDISYSVQKVEKEIPPQKISDEEMKAKWLEKNEIKVYPSAKEMHCAKMNRLGMSMDGFRV